MAKLSGSNASRLVAGIVVVYVAAKLVHGSQRGEHVETAVVNGETYELYFHRKSKHYSTIRKNGALILDSREDTELENCLFDLVPAGSLMTWSCRRSSDGKVFGATLP